MSDISEQIKDMLCKRIDETNFTERLINSIDWTVKDFDANFKSLIKKILGDIIIEYMDGKKDVIKEMIQDELEETIQEKIRDAVKRFKINLNAEDFECDDNG